MPLGYKLESEENFISTLYMRETKKEIVNNEMKEKEKAKSILKQKHKRNSSYHKSKKYENNSRHLNTSQKCLYIFNKLKESPLIRYIYIDTNNFPQSFLDIEKKIKEEKYTNLNEFSNDFDNFCQSNLNLSYDGMDDKNIEKNEKIIELKKLFENINKELEDFQKNLLLQNKNIPINDKPMSQKDRIDLANYIRCLPDDQLKGVINLLDVNSEVEKKKGYYELDIEQLSNPKLRELEKYVKSCMKSSKNFIPLRYKEEFNSRKKIEKEKNKENSVENKVTKDNNINNEEKENNNKEKNENDKEKNENTDKENIENNNKEENENENETDNNNDNNANNENNENQNINQSDNIEIGIKT